MIEYQFRPLSEWPGTLRRDRRNAPFRSHYSQTLQLLDRELAHLRAKRVVIEAAFRESDIRRDGRPRADARQPSHPGIVLSFETPNGPLRFPCDTYAAWEDNLRAIALALEALRKVDRYGVTRRGEQYRGWRQLPGGATVEPAMTVEEAAEILCKMAGNPCPPQYLIGVPGNIRQAYRAAALRTHPDRNGGDDTQFKKLQEARRVLEQDQGPTGGNE